MGKTILVSAGHSTVEPKDSGAVGNGFVEADEALKLRDKVVELLEGRNLTVITDGEDGESQPLKKAIELANTADVAVEIHFNAAASSQATGIEVLSKAAIKPLAQDLADAVHQATNLNLRGGDGGWKSDTSGQHRRLGFCNAGGAIIEVCFISNPNDMNAYVANFARIATNLANVLATA
jgi:N-acetylmuramoyl-L-alanine amidase